MTEDCDSSVSKSEVDIWIKPYSDQPVTITIHFMQYLLNAKSCNSFQLWTEK